MAEGNCMSTPVCLANAVSDALGVNIDELPMSAKRLHQLLGTDEPARPEKQGDKKI